MLSTKAIPPVKIERSSYKDWLKGTNTAYDDGRTPSDGLRASGNVLLTQDGTVRPRPSLIRWGSTLPGTLLGEVFEFTKTLTSTTENWLIAMFNVSGTTRPYVSKDAGAWQATTGKTYDNSAMAHLVQIDDKVIIMNGTDNLSYFDITTAGGLNTITPFTTLASPTSPTATKSAGFTPAGTTLTYYYRITANSSFGETAETVAATVQVSKQRETWDSTSYVDVAWTASVGAISSTTYNVYVGVASGQEFLIASGLNGTSYRDDGTAAQDVTRLAPSFDNTAGPKTTRGWVINGQLFMTGDLDHPHYIWNGGVGAAVLDFSPLNGGGYTEIGRGSKEFPVRVLPFRDHAGNPGITALCQGTNGRGKRYILTPTTITDGSTTISFFDVQEDNGQDGTDSPDGVVLYKDSIWYPSRDGFKTTGTKPQLQNVLSTNSVSQTIEQDVINLNSVYMGKCVGLAYQQRIYWALCNGSTTNNEIWVLDLEREGAWMKPLNIAADWISLYNDNSGTTHFLVLKNNLLYEMSYSSATNDDGVAFSTNLTSGILKFSDDGQEWGHLIDVTFIVLRPQGSINFLVTGKTEDSELANVGSQNLSPISTIAGWGEAGWGGSPDAVAPMLPEIFGWSNFSVVPTIIGSARYPVVIDVDEDVKYWSWELDTNTTGVDYQLSDVIGRFVRIGAKDES